MINGSISLTHIVIKEIKNYYKDIYLLKLVREHKSPETMASLFRLIFKLSSR